MIGYYGDGHAKALHDLAPRLLILYIDGKNLQ